MRKRGRAVVGVSCALIGAAVVFAAIHVFRAKHALRDYKARLAAAGEKFSIDELVPTPSAEARTAADNLLQAGWQLRPGKAIPSPGLRAMASVGPGKAAIAWKQPDIRDGESTNSWDAVMADLTANAGALDLIREALKSPQFEMNLDYHAGFNLSLPYLTKAKNVAQWLSAAAVTDLHAGRLEAANANLTALVSLANAQRDERLLISQLVRIAIAALAVPPTWEALQADDWTDAQLADLQRAWSAVEFQKPIEAGLAMERAWGLEFFERLRESDTERRSWLSGDFYGAGFSASAGSASPTHPAGISEMAIKWSKDRFSNLNAAARSTAWRWLWCYDDELRYLQTIQIVIEQSRRARIGQAWVAAQAWKTNAYQGLWKPRDRGASMFSLSTLLGAALHKASANAALLEAQRELVRAAIAIKRYRLRHGSLPPSLEALVPEILDRLPVDIMVGQPLRYLPKDDGSFLLYSVGEDGKDDGGNPGPVSTGVKSASPMYHTLDLVWPMPATAAEAAMAPTK